ncbi:MAG: hypothetical protein E4G94_00045 [ANME-2 cluster archaeon]|nr:MAG: hypothetical protein E4G94_00045 [ANME-2 cluster archaeon]
MKGLISISGIGEGAVPLKRTIQQRILDPLAMKILNREFGEGDSIEVDLDRTFRRYMQILNIFPDTGFEYTSQIIFILYIHMHMVR